eukprot:2549777-Prymnesium_polylepis.2
MTMPHLVFRHEGRQRPHARDGRRPWRAGALPHPSAHDSARARRDRIQPRRQLIAWGRHRLWRLRARVGSGARRGASGRRLLVGGRRGQHALERRPVHLERMDRPPVGPVQMLRAQRRRVVVPPERVGALVHSAEEGCAVVLGRVWALCVELRFQPHLRRARRLQPRLQRRELTQLGLVRRALPREQLVR